ncbi:MAG: relaxase domain-containing protein, partial [Planctomycetota bacterium]|nr:relaxase domain-containing protein [Planctomycetota bacterium]
MVASIKVMGRQIGPASVSAIAEYFTALAGGDYYTGSGEPPGLWFGEGANVLGLQGIVGYEALVAVLSGEKPVGGGRLVRKPRRSKRSATAPVNDEKARQENAKSRRRREWVPGFDLTLSVPKSVSGLWAVANPNSRSEIDQAIDQAARQTLAWLEQSVRLTRRGVGGFSEERARLVVAMFHHTVPRNFPEPQRHVHCLIANACCRADGSWATINSRAILNWTRTVGPVFRANLAAELKRRLGLELIRPLDAKQKPATWFEVKGVPATLLSQWSSRSGQIDELLEGIGEKTGNNTPAARQRANLLTRKPKTAMPRREDLFRQWQQEAAKHGFGEEQAQRLVDRSRPADFEKAYRHAWQQGLRELTREQSHFAARQVIQHVCEALQDQGVSGTMVAERVCTDLERSKQVIALDTYRGEMRFTTQQIWRREEKLLADVQALSKHRGAAISAQSAKQIIEANPSLSDEQAVAANLLLTADSAIRVLTGVAGAGKSRTLGAVREGFEQAGYRVIGGAVAGAAKEELAVKAGIESRTLASYFFHWDGIVPESARQGPSENLQPHDACKSKLSNENATKLDDRTVIIIDEAGQLDTSSAARLIDHVKRAGATLILTGDESQLPPILAGAPLRRIAQEVPSAHLQENLRQKAAPEDLAAAHDIRCGDALNALESYAQRGRLTIAKDRKEALRQLVTTWAKEGGFESPQEAIIF